MLFQVLMAVAGLFALFSLGFSKDYYARFIVLLMCVSVTLTLLSIPTLKTVGLVLYSVSLVLTIVYALLKSEFSARKRSLLLLLAIPVVIALMFQLNQWPAVNIMYGLTGLSLISALFIFIGGIGAYKSELGILAIIIADALIHVVIYFQWQLYSF